METDPFDRSDTIHNTIPIPEGTREFAVCRECDCDMVYPIDWGEVDVDAWIVTTRCPNCEIIYDAIMDEDSIEEYDKVLDRGTDVIVRDLRVLTYANMATEINVFVDALNSDNILPEDF